MTKPLVIYHGNCQDGFTAAWAAWLAHPDWEFYPATHGNPPPNVTGRDVFMLDFSYKAPVLTAMAAQANSITVLDHHASAQADLAPLLQSGVIAGLFDMSHSGAYLSWVHFHDSLPPALVFYAEDRDLWKFELNHTRAISSAIFSYEYDFQIWNKLADTLITDRQSLIDQGSAIDRKLQKDIAELLAVSKYKAQFKTPAGSMQVWVANLPYTMASDAAHKLCIDSGLPFAATYYDRPEGRTYSLRSTDSGADVSEIAKIYGGGGHPHAAGFTLAPGQTL